MSADLNRGACKNRLDHCQIQESIVTTAPDNVQIGVQNLRQHSSVAVQAIQTDQDPGEEKLLRRRIPANHLKSAFEFSPVVTIARSPKGAQELMRMCLQNRGAGSHHFPSLAPLVLKAAQT